MSSIIRSRSSMSNTGYHQNGKPNWWARIGTGDSARFLDIPRVRGDSRLVCEVDVPAGTQVYIGAGKGNYKTIRETVTTEEIDVPEPTPSANEPEQFDPCL